MSAPAIKLRPAPISTIALTPGSALPRSTFSTMPSGTPGLSALTGGLSMVMTPIPSAFSKRTNAPSAMSTSQKFTTRQCASEIISLSHCLIVRLNCRLRAEDHGALRRQHAAIAVGDRGLAIGDLARAALMAQLPRRLDQQEQSV